MSQMDALMMAFMKSTLKNIKLQWPNAEIVLETDKTEGLR